MHLINIIGGVDPKAISIPKYLPFVINVPTTTQDIKSIHDKINIYLGSNIDYPRFSLGFQHYIHATKKGKESLNLFENKKKVYNVMNPFETSIDNYDKSISMIAKQNYKIDIISDDFYKLWEMLFMFDILDINGDMQTLHINEEGGFIQSVLIYIEQYARNNNNKHYVMNPDILDIKDIGLIGDRVFYNELNKTIQENKKVIIKKDIKERFTFITINPNLSWVDETNQEGEYLKLLVYQINKLLQHQKKNGSCIIKIYETYTTSMVKIIIFLSSLYNKTFIVKPLTSRPSISEKYIVCNGFKYGENDKELKDISKSIEKMVEEIKKNNKMKVMDVFTNYQISNELKYRILQANIHLMNSQSIGYNKILSFIDGGNYYGDEYQDNKQKQIEANEYWNNLFYPNEKEFKERKTKIIDISFIANKLSVDKAIELNKKII